MPYTLYAKQYQVAPLFYWQSPRDPPPDYRHPRIASYWTGYDLNEWHQQSTWSGFARGAWDKLRTMAIAFVAPATLALALIGLPWVITRRAEARRAAIVLIAFLIVHVCTTPWMRMHYMGPIVPAFVALVTFCLIELHRLHFATAVLARAVVAVQLAAPVAQIVAMVQNPNPQGIARQVQVIERLNRLPGEDLVLVAYTPGLQHLFEWVYNPADVDRAPIVFAHDMGNERNRELLEYYPNRRVWRLVVDWERFDLTPLESE
jgi:hypothetical protein